MIADLRPALRAFLLADSSVSAAIGGARIHPDVLPQGDASTTVPALVLNSISEVTDHVTTGASGLVMVRMQIDAYAETADAADSLSRAVKDRIDGYHGPMGDIMVQGVFAETARTGYEPDTKLHRYNRDYLLWYAER